MKLFSIIKTFDNKQWTTFLSYIQLYHKSKSAVYKVAAWLDKESFWTVYNESESSTEKMLLLYKGNIKPQSLLNALTTLGNLAEEYVGWMVWKNSSDQKRSCQLIGLAQKGLTKEFLKTQNSVLVDSKSKKISIWDDYYKMRSIFNDYYFGISQSEDNYTKEFNNLISSFKKFTATIAQFILVEIKNREKLLAEPRSPHSDILEGLYNIPTELVIITDQLILMNSKGDVKAYNYLKQLLWSSEIEKYSLHIKYSIVSYCEIFLLGIIKKGAINRGQELLDLYEHSLEKGIFTLNDTMPLKNFINIIGVASKLEKYDWARIIVNNWGDKVDESNSKSISKFGHAIIDFHQQKYEKVVDALLLMKSSNFQHRLRSRWLLLRAQYELNTDNIQILKIQVDNFRRFLLTNKSRINRSTYEGLKSSIFILNMLLNRKSISQIKNFYETSKYIFERKWIVEKIKNPMR